MLTCRRSNFELSSVCVYASFIHTSKTILLLRRGKNLRCDAFVDAVVEFVVPDLARGTWLVLDPFDAGIVIRLLLRTCRCTFLTDGGHGVDWFLVRLL